MPHNAHLGANFIARKREHFNHVPYLAEYFISSDENKIFLDLHVVFRNILNAVAKNDCDFIQNVEPSPSYTLSPIISPEDCKIEFIDANNQAHIMVVQPIFHADPLGRGFYPNEINPWTLDFLIDAISHQRSGNQAVILFLALNSGITSIHPAHHIDAEYVRLLDEAKQSGVEIATAQVELEQGCDLNVTFNSIFEFDQQSL